MKLNFNYYKIIFFILNSLFKLVIILSYFLLICDLENLKNDIQKILSEN